MGNLRVQRRFCSEYGEAYAKTGIGMKSGQSFRISGIRRAVKPRVTIIPKSRSKGRAGFRIVLFQSCPPAPEGKE